MVHTEVEFVPLYREQPLFADVDQALRGARYGLFALDLDRLDADELVRLFVILHVAYGATDLCARVLERLDARTGNAAAGHYREQALAAWRPTADAGTG